MRFSHTFGAITSYMVAARRTAHLIANSKSGKGMGESLPDLAKRLAQESGIALTHHSTENPAEFEKQIERAVAAAEKEGGTVIAAGGDGTIRSVAQVAAGRKVAMGVVACGTFNFFARGLKIPEDCEEGMRLALTGEVRAVRLGRVNEHYFLINASLGLYAKSIRDREKSTSRFGRNRLVVIISTMASLFSRHRKLDVELATENERTRVKTLSIFIGNNALQLRDLALDVARCMKKNLLAVVVLRPVGKMEMLRILFRGFTKTLEHEERLETFCVDSLSIDLSQHLVTVALDGEMFQMKTPLKVEAVPGAVNLVLPPLETPV